MAPRHEAKHVPSGDGARLEHAEEHPAHRVLRDMGADAIDRVGLAQPLVHLLAGQPGAGDLQQQDA
eukprot:CAMPEP_0198557368 /NCGR_PEP_ID=MMETSP1462-20131121/88500_1 /TAXON_ID=1333877 /ORGANISM="Brandtodinium nutriculum, Strain RCC3387" /LENGTH=65 /DNA_ID=CAMNT_0044288143 /DNA_START=556 /DNA_END=749 /DNA_ORIENTATION=+